MLSTLLFKDVTAKDVAYSATCVMILALLFAWCGFTRLHWVAFNTTSFLHAHGALHLWSALMLFGLMVGFLALCVLALACARMLNRRFQPA